MKGRGKIGRIVKYRKYEIVFYEREVLSGYTYEIFRGGRSVYYLGKERFCEYGHSVGDMGEVDEHRRYLKSHGAVKAPGPQVRKRIRTARRFVEAAKWVVPGADITGDGKPNLVVWNKCHRRGGLSIFQVGRTFKHILTVDLGEAGPMLDDLVDLDRDGYPEIELNDTTNYCSTTTCGGSPTPRVVLKWKRGKFRVAGALMRRPAPSDAALRKEAKRIAPETIGMGAAWEHLFKRVIDLVYSGNATAARKLVRYAYPKKAGAALAWWKGIVRRWLPDSPYYRDIVQLNGGKL